ncbi:hypothetical protein [Butyrivibrio sp. AD3002]|uniref:hypothetical protein n=1 Tax=Butyrivibrio sp. AD3002 TaxID=1280670 RepID=UPI0003B3C474|nr:hypothetical protein [Butyrivibrio sp. AD3002]
MNDDYELPIHFDGLESYVYYIKDQMRIGGFDHGYELGLGGSGYVNANQYDVKIAKEIASISFGDDGFKIDYTNLEGESRYIADRMFKYGIFDALLNGLNDSEYEEASSDEEYLATLCAAIIYDNEV